ncbi:MAG: hypothetical protein ACNA8G_08425 [Gammaproteobacteria bacterium]
MNDWLKLMLEEIRRKAREREEAEREHARRETARPGHAEPSRPADSPGTR